LLLAATASTVTGDISVFVLLFDEDGTPGLLTSYAFDLIDPNLPQTFLYGEASDPIYPILIASFKTKLSSGNNSLLESTPNDPNTAIIASRDGSPTVLLSPLSACASSPCQNGGTCQVVEDSNSEFTCTCADGFTGDKCGRFL